MASDLNLVQAIYTFKGKNNDELCFKKGDVITVSQREEGGWWEGTLGDVTGWFPSNYVKEFKDSGGSAATSPVRAPSEVQAFRNVVLKDIIDSEKAHVAELQGIVNNFLQPLEKSDILTRDEYRQLTGNILEVLQLHEELLALIEECGAKTGPDQRVGGLFLQWAPKLKAVHETYCASHPRAVCILDKYKDELNAFMEHCGAVCPGILVLTTGLSKPFRRLHKYAAMLQELGRHVVESHPDRGDTHRAVVVYKDIASGCAATRRQKELELQVVTGAVRGWRCPAGLGEVLHMGGVALGAKHHDRYLVLFPATLLVLSVSKRMSAFVYEGSLPLSGLTITKLEDTDSRKNAFEISGQLIETIVAVCQTSSEADKWVTLLHQHSNQGQGITAAPGQPSHMSTMEMSNNLTDATAINHKRSHSFNNHHSYTHYLQHQQPSQHKNQQNEIIDWLQNSSDALSTQGSSPINSSKHTSTIPTPKISAFEFAEKVSLSNNFQGWTVKCLRPAPPLRPLMNLGEESGGGGGGGGAAHPYAPSLRKINSYEEDGLILRVIEAYCTSARSRHTVNSVDLGHITCGNVQTHAHMTTNHSHANSNSPHISQFDVCYNLKPLNVKVGGSKVRRNHSALPSEYKPCLHKVPETKKLLTERKFKLNRSNPSIADLGRCSSDSPLRRSAPLLDVNPRRVSSPLLGGGRGGGWEGRGAVLLPARAPSLPLASAWCCGSFVKQLRKTHHFD